MGETTISLELSRKAADRLDDLARTTNRSPAELAAEAIDAYLDVNAWQVAAIAAAVAEADAGGPFVAHEDMDRWLASWGTDDELDPPEARPRR